MHWQVADLRSQKAQALKTRVREMPLQVESDPLKDERMRLL